MSPSTANFPHHSGRAWLSTAIAVILFLVARGIPLPGVDHEALRSLENAQGQSSALWSSSAIAGTSILLLVIFRGFLALLAPAPFERPKLASRMVCAVYLLLSAARGFGLAISLEAYGYGFVEVVDRPGLLFRLTIALTVGASAAIQWALADWISARGIGRGPLVLFGVSSTLGGYTALMQLGAQAGRDGIDGVYTLITLAAGLPLALVFVALSRRGALEWPVVLKRGLVLSTPIDLLVMPYLVGHLVLELIQRPVMMAAANTDAAPLPWLAQLDTLGALATAAGITVWIMGRPARGVYAGYVAAAICAPMIAVMPVAVAIAADRDATFARFFGQGKGFEGDAEFDVLLTAEGGDGGRDAPILVQRLRALGVSAEIGEAASGRIRLKLTGSEELQAALGRVLMRGKLLIAGIAQSQGPLRPDQEISQQRPGLEVRQEYDGTPYYVAKTRPEIEDLASTVPKDREVGIGKDRDSFVAWVLDPATLTERDVKAARTTVDPMTGRPLVQVELTAEAARRFADATERMVKRKLAIVLDGEIVSAPVVQSRIDGGSVQIVLGGEGTPEESLATARALAAALESRAMSCAWSLASIAAAP